MPRALKILGWTLGVVIALPALLVAGVLAFVNTAPGQRLIERELPRLTAGTLALHGLSGRIPDRLRVAQLQLRDGHGAWLTLDGVTLDWSPLRLLQGVASVQSLSAARIDLPRLPASQPGVSPPAQGSGSGFTLPVRVVLDRLHVGRLDLGAAVAGAAATLGIDGSAAVASLQQGQADVTIRQIGGDGSYHLAGRLDPATLQATLQAQEGPHGPASALAGLPDLGALSLQASLNGPRAAAAVSLALAAGPLRAQARGLLDLAGMAADLDVTASAPAMAPRPDVSWQSVALDAHVHGPFARPDATGTLRIAGLKAAGGTLDSLSADVQGDAGRVDLTAVADGLRIPGPKPELLAAAPLRLQAEARLDQPARPVTFTLTHPLLQVSGHADTAGAIAAAADMTFPDLAPLAAVGGVDLQGRSQLAVHASLAGGRTSIAVDGTLGVTGGMAPLPGLIGDSAKLGVSVALQGSDITLTRAQLDGRTLSLSASGADRADVLDLDWKLALADLHVLAPSVSGTVTAQGHVAGRTTDLAVTADASGDVGAPGVPRGPITLALHATGLPSSPSGGITAQGTLDGAPLNLDADVSRDAGGTLQAQIRRADWKSAHAEGAFTLAPDATLPIGTLDLRMARLADLAPLLGQPVRGSVTATAALDADQVNLKLDAVGVGLGGNSVGRLALAARVDHPTADPVVSARLTADDIAAGGITGRATLTADGRQAALGLRLTADLAGLAGGPAQASATATLDLPGKRLSLAALQADWRGEALRLLAPARLSFGDGVAVDRLRLGLGQASLDLAGRVSPALDLTVALRGVTPDLAKPFAPAVDAAGLIQADAHLTGTPARPTGELRLTATGLRMRTGPGRALPPASLTASAALAGTSAHVQAMLAAGSTTHLSLSGDAPLAASGPLALHAIGAIDLALADPILGASGERLGGTVSLDATVGGTPAAPRLAGGIQLAHGDFQDFAQGVHLAAISAALTADGDSLRISRFSAQAGTGSIGLSGSIGVLAPGLPIELTLTMHNAQPLASDRLTATLDAQLSLRGSLQGHLAAGGSIHILRADIGVPDSLPASVAVLDVRRAGQPPPPPPPPPPDIALDITLTAPQQIFVRGRGLDAELGGTLHLGGTAAAPRPSGGFELRSGTFSVAGTTLTFSKGEVSFNGASAIDPTLDFEASSTTSNVTATLAITGYADKPKITLSSTPELPQDEVLSYLLFRRSTAQLTPFQLAAIAQALASFSGVGGGIDPLDSLRQGLGLDRLSVGGGSGGNAAELQAGRYVAQGVYVGAKQGTSGTDTQAQVQVDITKGLKLETDVGSGPGGTSVGLTYQFEY
jgi:translocation and assembly module TamB